MSGLELSEITEDAAWVIFDASTATAMLMASCLDSIDEDVAEIITVDLVDYVKDIVTEELEKLGWTQE